MKEIGLNKILPKHCYPLKGQIILKEKNPKRIIAIGNFCIKYNDEDIITEFNLNDCYYKLNHRNNITILNADECPTTVDYELIAKTEFEVENESIHNIYITGKASINSDILMSMKCIQTDINAILTPLFDVEGCLCEVHFW